MRAFKAYRSRNLHVLVSYSDTIHSDRRSRGKVLADDTVLSERIRRHSQGARLGVWASQGQVIEFVLVARPQSFTGLSGLTTSFAQRGHPGQMSRFS